MSPHFHVCEAQLLPDLMNALVGGCRGAGTPAGRHVVRLPARLDHGCRSCTGRMAWLPLTPPWSVEHRRDMTPGGKRGTPRDWPDGHCRGRRAPQPLKGPMTKGAGSGGRPTPRHCKWRREAHTSDAEGRPRAPGSTSPYTRGKGMALSARDQRPQKGCYSVLCAVPLVSGGDGVAMPNAAPLWRCRARVGARDCASAANRRSDPVVLCTQSSGSLGRHAGPKGAV